MWNICYCTCKHADVLLNGHQGKVFQHHPNQASVYSHTSHAKICEEQIVNGLVKAK